MAADTAPHRQLDLRGTPCPLNFIRTRLTLESVPVGAVLEVLLDRGEPERMVADGIAAAGHGVSVEPLDGAAVRLRIRCSRV
ncbi:MAG: sulfurtransferase TusA family protein [Cyanobacteriota bacterium]|jgi:TusA-related sulfurtransferase|nr:sulfurtransferase TusA family protein [Cyanobacteriota bacterium]